MTDPVVSNADLVVLLGAAAADESDHRRRALERAAGAARFWPREAAEIAAAGASLTTLAGVGPWIAERVQDWLDDPPSVPEPDETRTGYLTLSQVRRALSVHPDWESTPHADLQMHSTDSDGSLDLADMVEAARLEGRTFVAATDHSQSLTIAHGQDAERLRHQGDRIDAINTRYAGSGEPFRVLKSIEMDVFEDGTGDMEADDLARIDLVLGAFHSKLRVTTDVTDRYLAALANPNVHVLAHPKARMYGRRAGLTADWPRVFDGAARLGKAVELDATPNRQDLNVELATVANAAGVRWFSIGSDAHRAAELSNLPFAMATAVLAGIPRERILNYRTADEVRDWARAVAG